jgi:hypothetical protein
VAASWTIESEEDGCSPHPVWLTNEGLDRVHCECQRRRRRRLDSKNGSRAALIYQHGSKERQQAIADAMSQLVTDAMKPPSAGRSGTQRARKRRPAS